MKQNIKENAKRLGKSASNGMDKVKKIKIVEEFRTFISRGNVLDLAVGVIIGGVEIDQSAPDTVRLYKRKFNKTSSF